MLGSSGGIGRNSLTCSSRMASQCSPVGGSMARKATTWSIWFSTTSRRLRRYRRKNFPPAFDPELLCHCDLHTLDVIPVPDRFEKAVGKAKEQKIENGLFTQGSRSIRKIRSTPEARNEGRHQLDSCAEGEIAPEGLPKITRAFFSQFRLVCERKLAKHHS